MLTVGENDRIDEACPSALDGEPRDLRFFNAVGLSSVLWPEQSRGLHFASKELQQRCRQGAQHQPFFIEISLMLGGFAVETLCKMVSVSHHHGKYGYPAKATKLKQIFSPTHDLSLLAANARIRINKEDREILRNLSRYVIWAGRYPAPLVSQDYNGPAIFRDSDTAGALWDAYERLYKKMYRLAVRRAFRK